jgi:hypothetical protein
VTAAEVHDLAAAVNRVQARTTRSRQTALGASELGTCRRRTAYRLARTPETNTSGGMAAALGTWIHKGALQVLRREYGAWIEVRLTSPLIRGHADAVYPEGVVEDLKTRGRFVYAQTVDTGPRIGELFQVHIYGWLLRQGHIADRRRGYPTGPVPIERVRLRYLNRDTGEDFPWEADYDPAVTAEALAWLAEVLEALETGGPESVPRDGDGPGASQVCDWCPFLDACWGPPDLGPEPRSRQSRQIRTDEDAAAALADYARGRALAAEGETIKRSARLRLDGTPPGICGPHELLWTVKRPKLVPDTTAMIEMLERMDRAVPMMWTPGGRTIGVRPARTTGEAREEQPSEG